MTRTGPHLSPAARLALLTLALLSTSAAEADDAEPIGHWRLAGDAKDASVNRLDATNHGVKFAGKGPGGRLPAAVFDGTGSRLEVRPSPALRLGTGDFTVALWAHTPESLDDNL